VHGRIDAGEDQKRERQPAENLPRDNHEVGRRDEHYRNRDERGKQAAQAERQDRRAAE